MLSTIVHIWGEENAKYSILSHLFTNVCITFLIKKGTIVAC